MPNFEGKVMALHTLPPPPQRERKRASRRLQKRALGVRARFCRCRTLLGWEDGPQIHPTVWSTPMIRAEVVRAEDFVPSNYTTASGASASVPVGR